MTDDAGPNPVPDKPAFSEWVSGWLESVLPFKLPRIPLPKVAKNFDKAAARIVMAGGLNIAARLNASTKRIHAQSEADTALINKTIEVLGSSNETAVEFAQRALSYTFREAASYQQNRERILQLAAAEIERNPPKIDATSDIEDDWLNAFSRFAQEKSAEDAQQIWAKILASEIRNPGACSIRTMDFLAKVNSADAKRVVRIFTFVLSSSWIPRYVSPFEEGLLSHDDMLFADESGIITGGISIVGGTNVTLRSTAADSYLNALKYFRKVGILRGPNASTTVQVQIFPLSQIAKELYAISDTIPPDYGFFQSFCMSLSKGGGLDQISLADVAAHDGEFLRYANEQVVFNKKPK